jgi:hypothetical protein
MTRFMNYISNAKVITAISESIPRAGQAVRLCRDLASENLTAEEAIVSAVLRAKNFIADELECRESSMMPPSDGDAAYIESAKAALLAIEQIETYLGVDWVDVLNDAYVAAARAIAKAEGR